MLITQLSIGHLSGACGSPLNQQPGSSPSGRGMEPGLKNTVSGARQPGDGRSVLSYTSNDI